MIQDFILTISEFTSLFCIATKPSKKLKLLFLDVVKAIFQPSLGVYSIIKIKKIKKRIFFLYVSILFCLLFLPGMMNKADESWRINQSKYWVNNTKNMKTISCLNDMWYIIYKCKKHDPYKKRMDYLKQEQ